MRCFVRSLLFYFSFARFFILMCRQPLQKQEHLSHNKYALFNAVNVVLLSFKTLMCMCKLKYFYVGFS